MSVNMETTIHNQKITDVAEYIGLSSTTKGLSISPLKLQKLLYYVQAWFMVFYGRENTLFEDVPQAWVNGPVYPAIYYAYKNKAANMCDHLDSTAFYPGDALEGFNKKTRMLGLNADQLETLESVIMMYGKQTQNQLIWLTHSELPWAKARAGLAPYERSEREISLDVMYRYYLDRYTRNRQQNEA